MSMRPGISHFPRPSIWTASLGAGVVAPGPIATMRPSRTMTVWSSRTRSASIGITATCVIANALAGAGEPGGGGAAEESARPPVPARPDAAIIRAAAPRNPRRSPAAAGRFGPRQPAAGDHHAFDRIDVADVLERIGAASSTRSARLPGSHGAEIVLVREVLADVPRPRDQHLERRQPGLHHALDLAMERESRHAELLRRVRPQRIFTPPSWSASRIRMRAAIRRRALVQVEVGLPEAVLVDRYPLLDLGRRRVTQFGQVPEAVEVRGPVQGLPEDLGRDHPHPASRDSSTTSARYASSSGPSKV